MGCCSPNYRKTVNEEEEKINQKGLDKLPLLVKIIIIALIVVSLIALIYI